MRLKVMIYWMVVFFVFSAMLPAQQRIVLVVNKTLLPKVEQEIIRLKNDLIAEGYSAFIQDWDYDAATLGYTNSVANRTEADKLIAYLKQKYDESATLHGAIFIGALPRYFNNNPPNDDRSYKDNAFMNLTTTSKKIWVSRIWGLGNDMSESIAGKEQVLIKRALDANHNFRKGLSRYPLKGNLCYSFDIAYASYFRGGNFEIANIAAVWPIYEPTYDITTPDSISNSRLVEGSDLVTYHAHGGIDNGGQDLTSLNMLEYNPQTRTVFSGWTHYEAGQVGGIASILMSTRNGGVVLTNSGGPYNASEIFSNTTSSIGFRSDLNARNSYGKSLLRNWAISNYYTVFNGDLSIQPKMFPSNQMPSISSFSADKVSGVAPLTVNFSNIAAIDPDGSITNYEIYSKGFFFGKFSPDYSSSTKPNSFQQIYSLPHRYKARLEVADNYMARATKEIEIAVAPNPTAALRVNVGLKYDLQGSSSNFEAYKSDLDWVDSQGQIWLHDQQYSAGTYGWVARDGVFGTDYNAVAGTENDYLYQTSNFVYTGKVLTYKVPLANGNYQLKLHFRENYVTGPNQRLMDINVNNQTTVTALDIFNEAGGNNIALVKNYNVTVANGILEFGISVNSASTQGYTILNAFEVIPQGYHNVSPAASITSTGGQVINNAINGTAPLTLQFSSNASDADGNSLYYQWVFSDNESSFVANPSHRFELPGTYLVSLLVHDGQGGAVKSQVTVNVAAPSNTLHINANVNSSTPNGMISPEGYVNVNAGANQTFTMTPFSGYQIASVIVDGVNVGAVSSYTFTNLTANHTIVANYQLSTDTTPPTTPTGLVASAIGPTSFTLTWNPSTDNVALAGYKIFKNGVLLALSNTTSYTVTALNPSTSYSMSVAAYDIAGNTSSNSTAISVVTIASDTTPPTAPSNLVASSITGTSFTLSWTASTDNVGISSYYVYRNDPILGANVFVGSTSSTSFAVVGLTPATTYTMIVYAYDFNYNYTVSAGLPVTTISNDTTSPSSPSGLVASSVTSNSFLLSWTASTDNVGVTGYKIFRGGVQIGTSASTNFSVTGLSSSTAYSMTVSAYDAAGNNSAVSSALSVTTSASIDTTAPTIPTGLSASAITSNSFTLSWSASTDAVGVTGYKVFKGGVLLGTSSTTSLAVTSLSASTAYSMTVSAYDAAGNNSAVSSALSVTTSSTAQSFTITTSSDVGGVVSPSGVVSIPNGGSQMFGFSANPGYQLGEVMLDGVSLGIRSSCFIGNVTANHTLHLKVTPINSTPTIPANLVASAITANSFTLSWSASTDTVGVTGYKIFKGGVQIGTSTTTSFAVTGLSAATNYSMTVSAYNAAGNNSGVSSALVVTTSAASDTTAPTVPSGLVASAITATSFTLSWTASTDNVGVTGYKIFKGGVQIGTSTTTNFAVTGLSASTAYSMTVSAYDAASNNSALSSALSVTTIAAPDTTAPTVPSGLVASAITTTSFTLSWTASTDAVGVAGYKIFKGGVQIGTSTTTNFAVTGLSASTAYSMTVSAYDAAANNSAVSSALSVTTIAAPDTTAPSVPSGLVASAITTTSFNLSWTASTDNVGVTGYKIFRGGIQIGTSTTTNFAVTGLSASTAYSMTVSAYDAAANNSAVSNALSVTTMAAPDTTAPTAPTGLVASAITANSFTLSWTASTDAVGVTGYKIFKGGVQIGISQTTSFAVTDLAAATTYSMTVSAYDAASNNSALSNALSVTTGTSALTITATCEPNGTITPSGIIPIEYGGSRYFSISPASGYQVSDVLLDGVSIGARWNLTLANVVSSHTVYVKINPITQIYTITALSASNAYTVESTNIKNGKKQSYVLTPVSGYKVSKVLVDGEDTKNFKGTTFSTIEMLVEPTETIGKKEFEMDKKYSSNGQTLVNISRVDGSEGTLGIRFEAVRYAGEDIMDETIINGELIWADGDVSDKSIYATSGTEAEDNAVYSIKLLTISDDAVTDSQDINLGNDMANANGSNPESVTSGSSGGGCNYAANMPMKDQLGNLIFMLCFLLVLFIKRVTKKIEATNQQN